MKKVFKSLGLAVLYFIAYFALQFLITVIFVTIAMMPYITQNLGNIDSVALTKQMTVFMEGKTALIALISNLLSVLILFFIWLGGKKKLLSAVSLKRVPTKDFALPAILGLTFYIAVSGILSILPIPDALMDQYSLMSDTLISGNIWIQLISIVIIAPITEELIFRGLILKRLSRGMHPIIAAIISSAIFGVAHGNPIWMAYAFCLGLVFAYICLKYRSVLASIAVHMVFNLFGIIEGNALKGVDVSGYVFVIMAVVGLAASTYIMILIARKNPVLKADGILQTVSCEGKFVTDMPDHQQSQERVLIEKEREEI